jgi:alpha/beta superfamily hydrolase
MRRSAEKFFLPGRAGALEAMLEARADAEPAGAAVICHPHPLHGGTMKNKVVHTLARAFVNLDFYALRFNFRGSGRSEGAYDDGRGELQDALAAIEWLRNQSPNVPLWVAGFSFGAAIAVRAAAQVPVQGLISVAPAASRFAGSMDSQPECPWMIIHGENDEVVDVNETIEWINRLQPGPELTVFPETTHFFHGKLVLLRESVENFVTANSG